VEIDLCQVGTIDTAGKALLARMFAEGVGLVVGARTPRLELQTAPGK
jgi:hypothetical protein